MAIRLATASWTAFLVPDLIKFEISPAIGTEFLSSRHQSQWNIRNIAMNQTKETREKDDRRMSKGRVGMANERT